MPEKINWRPDYPAAVSEAQKNNLPVALEFYLETWPHCARMVRETHADPEIIDYLNDNFIPVRLEARQNIDLAQKWNVRGVPLTLVLSPEAQEVKRLEGFQPPANYIRELQGIKG